MMLPFLIFVVVAGSIVGGYFAIAYLPGYFAARQLDRRLRDVSFDDAAVDPKATDDTVLKHASSGPLPGMDRIVSATGLGKSLARLIEQSGVRTTPSAVGHDRPGGGGRRRRPHVLVRCRCRSRRSSPASSAAWRRWRG